MASCMILWGRGLGGPKQHPTILSGSINGVGDVKNGVFLNLGTSVPPERADRGQAGP